MIIEDIAQARKKCDSWCIMILNHDHTARGGQASALKPIMKAATDMLIEMMDDPARFQEMQLPCVAFPGVAMRFGPKAVTKATNLLVSIGAVEATGSNHPPIKMKFSLSTTEPIQKMRGAEPARPVVQDV
jgi:hypothetical protein